MEKLNNKIKWILIALIIIIGVFYLILPFKIQKGIIENHPRIEYKDEVSGTVKTVKLNRGTIYFELNNMKKFSTTVTRNYDYSPYDIEKFVLCGDSIYKPHNSDTMYVFRNTNKYFFILGKLINEKE